jgi:hypothetical protein
VPFNEKFDKLGYSSHNLVLNMENSFPILVLNVVLTIILVKAEPLWKSKLRKESRVRRFFGWAYKSIVYNLIIRFFIESYLELFLITYVSYQKIRF